MRRTHAQPPRALLSSRARAQLNFNTSRWYVLYDTVGAVSTATARLVSALHARAAAVFKV